MSILVQPNKHFGHLNTKSELTTASATKFYAEQVAQRKIFDAIEDENAHFWDQVKSLNGIDVVSDLPADRSKRNNVLWESQCKENPIFELDCTHGTDCQRINNCTCAPPEIVAANEKAREEKIRNLRHNSRRNIRRRERRRRRFFE
jgi:hypothetical protein